MRTVTCLLAGCLLLGCAGSAFALNPGDRVENFRLTDTRGVSHELYSLANQKAVVIMTQGNGCPLVRQYMPAFKQVRDRYRSRGMEFLLLNSNLQDDPRAIATEATEFKYDMPIMVDDAQLIGESLGVTRTAEVYVIDTRQWKLVFRGPVDDRLSYERQKPAAQNKYLEDALDAMIAQRPVKLATVDSPGCLVNFPERERAAAHAKISYSKTIAPLLAEKCVACHRSGGTAASAMNSYDAVKGAAPKIREVVRVKGTPPWNADPHANVFKGARALTTAQAQTLVHWIEAGAPRGNGTDPLLKQKQTQKSATAVPATANIPSG